MKKKDKPPTKMQEQTANYDFERFEIIDGIRYDLKPSPKVDHQLILPELYTALRSTCHQNGVILLAPMDVTLDENNIVQPDLIYITNENIDIIKNNRIEGTPNLLAEVLSPSTGSRDKITKRALYARFGVQEYWVVDPVTYTLDQFVLDDDRYRLLETYGVDDRLTSPNFSCIAVDIASLFATANRFRTED
ncbi:Uma2 family endonuclease [Paenibacillus alkalitolerans]|uniref:Uma2 family endonuclease n=1 Tax=Paenibacillus alkalitolerans TaxID=2799335 RepID=UPI0018F4FDE6|nr:Uma2 family endonuclease [Paenibacillus alkalitolerans]